MLSDLLLKLDELYMMLVINVEWPVVWPRKILQFNSLEWAYLSYLLLELRFDTAYMYFHDKTNLFKHSYWLQGKLLGLLNKVLTVLNI